MLLVIVMLGLSAPTGVLAQAEEPAITQEYFIQQADDEDLFITVSAFEAEFESRITGANGEVLLHSGIEGSRIVPVFQYIYAPKSGRQLDIKVSSNLHTARTEFGIELARLKPWDSRSSSVSQAYKLLSFGTEVSEIESQANWTVKIDSVARAARLFEQFGMKEMRLWANYLTAHLIHFKLYDHGYVYSMTREILAELRGTRFQKIELATRQLQSLALIGLKRSDSLKLTADQTDPVQASLANVALLAEAMGYHFEQANALYASGLEFAEQRSYDDALRQFRQAVQIADSVGSAELATAIRESTVEIHTVQGDAPATSEVLQEIESQLIEDGDEEELALNLLAQARLLISNYHFGEAIEVLSGAMSYQNNSAVRRQINFELAKIFYESGRLDESLTYLQMAEIKPGQKSRRAGNPVIDVGDGMRILANIYRTKGEFRRMQAAREGQGHYKPEAAQYLYDQGMDVLARPGQGSQKAASLFRQSHSAAHKAGHVDLKYLAQLQYCALVRSADGMCENANLKTAYEWLTNSGVPRLTTEAMFQYAQIKAAQGQRSEALSTLDSLTDEILLLRDSLPGVLGAWYWERHQLIFETWLEILVGESRRRGRTDDSASLLALSKIRYVESYNGFVLEAAERKPATDQLREQLAQRARPGAGKSVFALNGRINQGLDRLRDSTRRKFEFLTHSGLQAYLRGLANDEIVLTYHLAPGMAQVWIGSKGKVERRDIPNPYELYKSLELERSDLAHIGVMAFKRKMDELGQRLLAPVSDLLTNRIYWIPSGPLLGFPVDALRIKGRYLIERHSVVNLLSFPLNTQAENSLQAGALEKVFLAGNPTDYSGDYATRLETSSEIRTVADIFIGPGLQIIQGVALLPDEFEGGFFQESNLVHLAMPGVIDLKYPGTSGFELSESEYEPGRVVLRPQAIRSQRLSAGLVLISSSRLIEKPRSVFSSQPGLVSDFLRAGADSVVIDFWSVNTESNNEFIADFYGRLQRTGDISVSLREARLNALNTQANNNFYDWAGYQVFIK
jgi:CHAT domain-containing protein